MTSMPLREIDYSGSFRRLAENLHLSSLTFRQLVSRKDHPVILIIEDSPTQADLLTHQIHDRFGDCEIIVVESWMQAARHLGECDAVIIDWFLPDGIDAKDCGAIDKLKRMGKPFFVYTSAPKEVPGIGCLVIDKFDQDGLSSALENFSDAIQGSVNAE